MERHKTVDTALLSLKAAGWLRIRQASDLPDKCRRIVVESTGLVSTRGDVVASNPTSIEARPRRIGLASSASCSRHAYVISGGNPVLLIAVRRSSPTTHRTDYMTVWSEQLFGSDRLVVTVKLPKLRETCDCFVDVEVEPFYTRD